MLCAAFVPSTWMAGCSASRPPLDSEPDCVGFITETRPSGEGGNKGKIVVESHADKLVARCLVTIAKETKIAERVTGEYHTRSFHALEPKDWVQVWFTESVTGSSPATFQAEQIVVFRREDDEEGFVVRRADMRHAGATRTRPGTVWLCGAALVILLVGACSVSPQEIGTLEGHASMTMAPVLREGLPEPTPAPEAWAVRQIVVLQQDGRKEVARVQIGPQGNYQVQLPAGTYLLDINHVGMDQGIDLPQTVEIYGGQVTRLSVKIDTGVR